MPGRFPSRHDFPPFKKLRPQSLTSRIQPGSDVIVCAEMDEQWGYVGAKSRQRWLFYAALLNKSDFVANQGVRVVFRQFSTLSGIPAFVILFSARTRAIASATTICHAASVNPRTAVLPGTSPFPLSSDGCNLLSISTAHYSRSFAD
jgi:hypothetical protein